MYFSIRKKILKRIINFPFFSRSIRKFLLRKMGVNIGKDVRIGDFFFISDRSKDKNHIHIEENVDIAANVTFITTSGPNVSRLKYIYETKFEPIVIKHDVWIGHGAIILPGTTVGEFSIIGAGTIVDGEIPSYSVVSGNPMKIKKIPSALVKILKTLN
jgi:acetyltransferase-like isoleucine patch superfamily enzyme